jgi:hypothetical protein
MANQKQLANDAQRGGKNISFVNLPTDFTVSAKKTTIY